ncbi:MAG: hypothetical protein KBD24_03115 [Candidatus Pacebacteria bacterium]|nr:hypothetical protein [Candidatus Paceibacterota bacterium]
MILESLPWLEKVFSWLRSWLRAAKFEVSVDPIRCLSVHTNLETYMYAKSDSYAQEMFSCGVVYLAVKQKNGSTATDVKILVNTIVRLDGKEGERLPVHSLYLTWEHDGTQNGITTNFEKGEIKYCLLGTYAMDTDLVGDPWMFGIGDLKMRGNPINDKFARYLPAGTYEIELILSGKNVHRLVIHTKLSIDGKGSLDESEMFGEHVQVST